MGARLMDEKIGKQAPFTSQPASHVTLPRVQVALSSYFSPSMNLTLEILTVHGLRIEAGRNPQYFKGAVSRQSNSFCLILPITRPQLKVSKEITCK